MQAGVTQSDLAGALQEKQSFISKCERGERRLDIIELHNFCNAIGLSLTVFTKELEKRLSDIEAADES